MHMDKTGIALEVLDAVGGKDNVTASDICMTRLRIMTEHPSLVDTEKLSSTRGVLGIVRRGKKGIEVVFSPGKAEDVYGEIVRLTGIEPDEGVFDGIAADGSALQVQINSSHEAKAQAESDDEEDSPSEELVEKPDADDMRGLVSLLESDLLSEGDSDDEEEDEDADDDDMDDDGARVLVLGGGRQKTDDKIDYGVGTSGLAKIGDPVAKGQPLVVVHANAQEKLAQAMAYVEKAFEISAQPVAAPKPIVARITG